MRGVDRRVVAGQLGQPPRGPVLRPREFLDARRVDQVGPPDAAVEQRPAGEHRDRTVAVADQVRHVVIGVTGLATTRTRSPPTLRSSPSDTASRSNATSSAATTR